MTTDADKLVERLRLLAECIEQGTLPSLTAAGFSREAADWIESQWNKQNAAAPQDALELPEEPRRYSFGGVMRGIDDMVAAADYDTLRRVAEGLKEQLKKTQKNFESASAQKRAVWDYLKKVSPWTESNDLPWESEIICSISLLEQRCAALEEELRGVVRREEKKGK